MLKVQAGVPGVQELQMKRPLSVLWMVFRSLPCNEKTGSASVDSTRVFVPVHPQFHSAGRHHAKNALCTQAQKFSKTKSNFGRRCF
jgi:hypothetical protein